MFRDAEDCLVLDVRSCTPCEAAWFELTSTAGKVSLGESRCVRAAVCARVRTNVTALHRAAFVCVAGRGLAEGEEGRGGPGLLLRLARLGSSRLGPTSLSPLFFFSVLLVSPPLLRCLWFASLFANLRFSFLSSSLFFVSFPPSECPVRRAQSVPTREHREPRQNCFLPVPRFPFFVLCRVFSSFSPFLAFLRGSWASDPRQCEKTAVCGWFVSYVRSFSRPSVRSFVRSFVRSDRFSSVRFSIPHRQKQRYSSPPSSSLARLRVLLGEKATAFSSSS